MDDFWFVLTFVSMFVTLGVVFGGYLMLRRRGYPKEVVSLLAALSVVPMTCMVFAFRMPTYTAALLAIPGVVNLVRGGLALHRFQRSRNEQGITSF